MGNLRKKSTSWTDLSIFLFPVFLLELIKVLFVLLNRVPVSISGFGTLLRIIFYSLRFDCLVLLFVIFPLYTIVIISRSVNKPWLETLARFLYIFSIFILATLSFVDLVYYHFNYQRLSLYELSVVYTNLGLLLPTIKQYWYFVVALVAILLITIYFFPIRRGEKETRVDFLSNGIKWFIVGIFLFVMSWDFKSGQWLTPTSAFYVTRPENTPLMANAGSELLYSLRNKKKEDIRWHSFDDSTAFHLQPVIHQNLRVDSTAKKRNIVIFIMESVSAEDFDPKYRKRMMPFLDSLIGHSLYFSNFYANGFTSSSGFDAIVGGMPQLGQSDYFSLGYGYNKVDYAAKLLLQSGYNTYFNYGVMEYGYSLIKSSKMYGLQQSFGYGNSEFKKPTSKNEYGVYDHIFFPAVSKQMATIPQPFFSVIFNVSTHFPFNQLPSDILSSLPHFEKSNGRVLYYLDSVYRQFFSSIKGSAWYPNTIFIFLSDHYSRAEDRKDQTLEGKFHIPMFIFSPDNSFNGTNSRTGQQIDIPPTVLDLAGYGHPYFAFGTSLLDSTRNRFAINRFKNTIELIDDSTLLQYDLVLGRILGYYIRGADSQMKPNLTDLQSDKAARQLDQLKAFLQVFSSSVTRNKMSADAYKK